MPNQTRVAKVLASLLASMTSGAMVLMVLGHNPPAAGPFSLWTYYRLDPVKEAITSQAAQSPGRWKSIEICYSENDSSKIEQLAALKNLGESDEVNCHFCVFNGRGGDDGQIQQTKKWQKQWSSVTDSTWYGNNQTIRICVMTDSKTARATDCQIKRVQVLVEDLTRKFLINPENIYYPGDWR
jgi:hypothetical protein